MWPWVAQVGADRGGFYSYEWLANLVGCRLRNADAIHPQWEVRDGDALLLHPRQPAPLAVVEVAPGRHFVAHADADRDARAAGRPWIAVSWLFLVEPLGPRRSRVISRFRCAFSDHPATRLAFGPALLEPIGYAMDRRMLLGIRSGPREPVAGARGRAPSGGQGPERAGQDPRPAGHVLGRRVLVGTVADAAPRGHEDHPRGQIRAMKSASW